MYNFLLRRGTSAAFIVGFIASIILIVAVVKGAGDFAVDDFANLYPVGAFGLAAKIGVAFVILGLIAIILGGIYGLVTNPKSALKFIIGVAVLIAFVGIFYAIAPVDTYKPLTDAVMEYDIQGGISKFISSGIIIALILMAAAFVVVLLAEVRNAFK